PAARGRRPEGGAAAHPPAAPARAGAAHRAVGASRRGGRQPGPAGARGGPAAGHGAGRDIGGGRVPGRAGPDPTAAPRGPGGQRGLEVAGQQGMEPAGTSEEGESQEEPAPTPPLIAEAYEAIEKGDLDAAVASYERHLTQNPGDGEAQAGLATVRLMRRTQGADLSEARQAAADRPEDLSAQLLVADLDMLGGHVDDAFGRLLEQLIGADAETKDAVRERLLELFEVAGAEDPRVPAARKRLANLLY